jgi:hypothetical protein
VTVNDRELAAAARILDETGKRPDAKAIRSRVGSKGDVTAALRVLAAQGYVNIIDMWQHDAIVREITPEGRRRLTETTPTAKAQRLVGNAAGSFVSLVVGVLVIVLGALVLAYFGLK